MCSSDLPPLPKDPRKFPFWRSSVKRVCQTALIVKKVQLPRGAAERHEATYLSDAIIGFAWDPSTDVYAVDIQDITRLTVDNLIQDGLCPNMSEQEVAFLRSDERGLHWRDHNLRLRMNIEIRNAAVNAVPEDHPFRREIEAFDQNLRPDHLYQGWAMINEITGLSLRRLK